MAAPLASRQTIPAGPNDQEDARQLVASPFHIAVRRGVPASPRLANPRWLPRKRSPPDQVSSLHCAGIEQPLRWTIAVLPLSTIAPVDFFCGRLHPRLTAGPIACLFAHGEVPGRVQTEYRDIPCSEFVRPQKTARSLHYASHRRLDPHDTLDWVAAAGAALAVSTNVQSCRCASAHRRTEHVRGLGHVDHPGSHACPRIEHACRSSGLGTFGVPDRVGYLVGHPDDVLDWVAVVI